MSTTIDQKVVEMRFDNAHFEKNVAQSLSTLEKLKQKLNLTGASKGLEDVGKAAKKVDLTHIANSADTVSVKFSHMQATIQHQLDRIVTRAVDAGERMVKALTIDPVKTGFQEYETQINAVQTILANTSSKGTTIDDVNKSLRELNEYADKTIYNFTEMTRNIGTFTAAGIDLDTATNAIQGIANLAAVSGSTSQQASTAMYQLSQALASGTVKLMDWNSVVNAGMGGQVFQDALKETARVHGIAIDEMIESEGSFRETLSKGWLSSDILTETLQKFTLTTENLSDSQIEANREMLRSKGYTEEQIEAIFKLGRTATDAATKVKTFTQLWDVLKEAAQSGWTQTWQLLVGDFEQAKSLLTPLSEFFTSIINRTSEWRNTILAGALTVATPFKNLQARIESVTGATEAVLNITKDYGAVVDKVIGGAYGNGQSRWDKLTEEGYDWAKVQNMINEKLGDSTRHTEKLTEAQNEQNVSQAMTLDQLVELSDARLKELNFTEEEIKAFRELEEQSRRTGIPIEDLIKDLDQLSGRSLLLNSFKNIGQSLIGVFNALKSAWHDVFPPKSTEERSKQLYNMIAALHKFTEGLKLMDSDGKLNETGEKIKRTFRGIAAALDLILTIVGGPIKIAFKALTQLLGAFDLNLLDITAAIGDAIYNFNEWVNSSLDFTDVFEKMVPYVKAAAEAMKTWVGNLKDSAFVKSAASYLNTFSQRAKELFNSFKNSEVVRTASKYIRMFADILKDVFVAMKNGDFDVAKNIIDGLVIGLRDGVSRVWDAALEIARSLLESVCQFLGIHSPSTEFIEVGKNIIDGLVNGIQNGFSKVWNAFKGIFERCLDFVRSIDFGKVFAVGASIVLLTFIKKIGDAIALLAKPIEGITKVLESTSSLIDSCKHTVESFQGVLKACEKNIKSKALKNMAIAVAILAASVIALSLIEPKKLWNAVGVVASLAGVLVLLSIAVDRINNASISIDKDGIKKSGFAGALLAIAGSLLLLAVVVKLIGNLDPTQTKQGFLGLAALIVAVGVVFASYGKLVKGKAAQNIDKAGAMMLKLAGSLLIMVLVAKMIAKMEWADIGKAGAFAGGFVVLIGALAAIGMIPSKNITKVGNIMKQLAGALLLMTIVAKLIAAMEWADMGKAGAGMLGLVGFVALLTWITKLAGKDIDKVGKTLMGISAAMLILTIVAKMISGMEWSKMGKGAVGLLGLTAIVGILVKIVDSMGKDAPKVAMTLLAISVAMGILAGAAIIMGLIDLAGLMKGVTAVSALSLAVAAMIKATRGANDVKGSIMMITIAIGVMAASAAILSLIDAKKLLTSTAALSSMMLSFAQIAKHAGKMQGSIGSLIVVTVAVGLMATAVYLLAKLPVESVLGTAAALSVLMLSLSVAFRAVNGPSFVNPMTLVTIGILTVVMGALGGILYLLKDLPIESTMANAIALSGMLLALSGACVILGVVGSFGPAAFIGVGALVTLVAAVGGLILGIGALADKFPKLEEFLNKGLPLLEKIGHGLGSFFGNIFSGFLDGLTDGLPEMGQRLGDFMTNLKPFIDGSKAIDENALNGVSSLVKMVALIGGASFIDRVTSFITGGSYMDTFASQIGKFGDAIVSFSNKVTGNIDEESVTAAANAGKLLAEMQNMVSNTGGVFQVFSGEKNLETFGTQLISFADAIVGFSNKVSGNINAEAVTAAASAGTMMAELQSKVATTGGVVQWFNGEKDMTTFGIQLIAFGEAIVGFSNAVKGGVDVNAVSAASTAGAIMTEMQNKIVPTGGVVHWFNGEKNLQTFGSQLIAFGTAIVEFSEQVSGNIDEGAVIAAANAGEMMAALQKSIPEDKWFDGKVSLDDFGKTINKFGGHVKSFSDKVSGLDVESINSSVAVTKQIVGITKSLGSVDPDNIGNFKAKQLGKAIKSYADNVSGLDTGSISASISAIKQLISVINNMAVIDSSGVATFKTAISSLSKTNLDGITRSFSSSAPKLATVGANIIDSITKGMKSRQTSINTITNNIVTTIYKQIMSKVSQFQQAGIAIITKFANGLNSGRSKVLSAVRGPLTTAVSSIRGYYSNFYSAGLYLVDGFASGISARTWKAQAKAKAMANAAEKAAKEALDINSPSKVFRALGYSIPEGLAMGIDKLAYMATGSASDMANNAIGGVKDAISKISSYMNEDIDSQPTIRPVLDLSDIKSGASAINGMFNSTQSVGVVPNIRSISSMMGQRNQNGANADIVSELSKLRSELGNVGGNSYNINGITYNDDSPIANAMKEIVRATIREGRV